MKPDIGSESLPTPPPAFDDPVMGGSSSRNIVINQNGVATRWRKNFEDMIARFDHEHDTQTRTHTQTDTQTNTA